MKRVCSIAILLNVVAPFNARGFKKAFKSEITKLESKTFQTLVKSPSTKDICNKTFFLSP
jgi:hypothetical protein